MLFLIEEGDFYIVFNGVFEEIYSMECQYRDDMDPFVAFGDLSSSTEEVLKFYVYWSNFETVLPFTSVGMYENSNTQNVLHEDAIQKNSGGKQGTSRMEYSKTVRSLAAFLKRRDVRINQIGGEQWRELLAQNCVSDIGDIHNDEVDDIDSDDIIDDVVIWCNLCRSDFESIEQLKEHLNSNTHRNRTAESAKKRTCAMESVRPVNVPLLSIPAANKGKGYSRGTDNRPDSDDEVVSPSPRQRGIKRSPCTRVDKNAQELEEKIYNMTPRSDSDDSESETAMELLMSYRGCPIDNSSTLERSGRVDDITTSMKQTNLAAEKSGDDTKNTRRRHRSGSECSTGIRLPPVGPSGQAIHHSERMQESIFRCGDANPRQRGAEAEYAMQENSISKRRSKSHRKKS
mmetsp:Transcript_3292/g.5132  ORF Transcript_3292/g.5132 Transcript_3292/m.5132 type:complete len:401 (+) Transcript_3292:399-1601(+)